MFKFLVFLALVYIAYRWYISLKKVVQARRRVANEATPPNRFDISHIEEADFRDLGEDRGQDKK